MKKSFKYRVTTNRETSQNLLRWIDTCRWLYNHTLEERISEYKNNNVSLSTFDQSKRLPPLKESHPELAVVNSQTLQNVVERVGLAFQHFFRRVKSKEKPGFPRFKPSHRYHSITLKQSGWKLDGKILTVNRVGNFRLKLSRPIEGDIKTVTLKMSPTGKWYVVFSCDNVPERILPKTGQMVGVDVGLESFLTTSDDETVENPRHFRKHREKLANAQKDLQRKKKGSIRRKKSRTRLARIHEKISNCRDDYHWKTARWLVSKYDTICIEQMNSWVSWRNLTREMRDAAWFGFFDKLRFKAEEAGREVIEVPARGTSQKCSRCGGIVKKSLSDRMHECGCGLSISRDLNAALNILAAGQAVQAQA